jgi:hypothetical protein
MGGLDRRRYALVLRFGQHDDLLRGMTRDLSDMVDRIEKVAVGSDVGGPAVLAIALGYGRICPTGKTPPRLVNPCRKKYSTLPKFGNGVCIAHPGSSLRGDRTSSLIASRACGGRGSVGTMVAGRAGSPCEPEIACG